MLQRVGGLGQHGFPTAGCCGRGVNPLPSWSTASGTIGISTVECRRQRRAVGIEKYAMRTTSDDHLTPLEEETTRYVHRMIGEIMRLLAQHFQGDTTLNHLRIGNFIGLRALYEGRPTNNRDIADSLGISRPTVSRIVSDFIGAGWVVERADPDDGRRRMLTIAPNHPDADRFEKAFRKLLNDLLERYEAGEIVQVDSGKRSFSDAASAK
ncbi:MAG: MarR family winged helix-turn-helix transcriptional regulator [Gammaproteobacteria bacterium]